MEIKMSFKEFCALAARELDYPKTDTPLRFVVMRHAGEQDIGDIPDYVYIEITKPVKE